MQEFERQRAKLIAALVAMDADVVGLVEMENTFGVEPMADIVAGLNDALGAGTYDYIDAGLVGDDVIKVGIIYQPASVTPWGGYAVLDSSVDPTFNDDKNRAVLAQSFLDPATGGITTYAVNHFKSKGSPCDDVGDPNIGDGQGNCNLTREAAAVALATWLASDPTGSGQYDSMILGDLNSYDEEDPITALLSAGYVDLQEAAKGEFDYSYVFDGQWGTLDYALASAGLASQVTGTTVWHINADEADALDYNTSFRGPGQIALFTPDVYRVSDHDPVLVGLESDLDAVAILGAVLDQIAALEADGTLNKGQAGALTRHVEKILEKIADGNVPASTDMLNGLLDQIADFVADGILTEEEGAAMSFLLEVVLNNVQ